MRGRSLASASSERRLRRSIAVTIRPRRLSMPAISGGASGTRVSRSGTNTSCTREMGRPNNWPPTVAVTYSIVSADVFMGVLCRRQFRRALLERRDEALAIEFGDVIVQSGLAPALERIGREDRRQADDRH